MAGSLEYPIGTEPTVGQQRSPVQLSDRFDYLLDVLNALVGLGEYSFPDAASAGTTNKALLSAGNGTTSWGHVARADALLNISGVSSLAAGDMLYFNGTNLVEISVGSSGQALKLAGAVPTWTSLTTPEAWQNKTSNFTTASGARYQCSSGVTSIALHSPAAGDEFWIKPSIGTSFITNSIAFTGSPQLAGAASTAFTLSENGIYHFVSNGTDYDVAAYPIAR